MPFNEEQAWITEMAMLSVFLIFLALISFLNLPYYLAGLAYGKNYKEVTREELGLVFLVVFVSLIMVTIFVLSFPEAFK